MININPGNPWGLALGQRGSKFINDTSVNTNTTGGWGIVYCVTACTFTTFTSGNQPATSTVMMAGTLSAMALSAAQTIYGNFTAITLASGSVIAYNA